jgi:nucleotidyltransferase/DNA polymerase involved in DNA repair
MFATIYLPNFYLQAACRHQAELARQPVALIDDQEAKAVIIQLNQAAEDLGVRVGMAPSQGLARSLALKVKTRLRTQEKLLDGLLVQFACTLAPYVEATAPGVVTIQFTNRKNIFRNVERVLAQLEKTGINAQAAIAPTPDVSFLAAHLARPILVVDETKDFLAPLSIETLALA